MIWADWGYDVRIATKTQQMKYEISSFYLRDQKRNNLLKQEVPHHKS